MCLFEIKNHLHVIFLFLIITLITRCLSQTAIPAGIPSFGSPPPGDGDFTNSPKSVNSESPPFPHLPTSLEESDPNLKPLAVPSATSQPMSQKTTKSPDVEKNAPSSGSPNTSPKSNNAKAATDLKKVPWQMKEKACIEVSLKPVPDSKRRDYSPNGKIMYDWGPMPIASNLTNMTNNYDWKVPYINHPRISNSSDFYIRVETMSKSGIFGSSVPLGGIYGPFSMELKDPPEGQKITQQKDIIHNSLGSKLWILSIKNIGLYGFVFGVIIL
ncbi:28528_t:CDS:2 [Gigaspora margarita]|uniref:28528_t:CDS:1 n=1 Tax=Gigaspora margarita TaxID=4874 RepID=A0ABN7V870_GIGMA|nr:28528_t:CDS:2 [Gigaspora margarita]